MFPIFFGIVGLALLVGLGIWQVQRLTWKNNLIREISESLGAAVAARVAINAETVANSASELPFTRLRDFQIFFIVCFMILSFYY